MATLGVCMVGELRAVHKIGAAYKSNVLSVYPTTTTIVVTPDLLTPSLLLSIISVYIHMPSLSSKRRPHSDTCQRQAAYQMRCLRELHLMPYGFTWILKLRADTIVSKPLPSPTILRAYSRSILIPPFTETRAGRKDNASSCFQHSLRACQSSELGLSRVIYMDRIAMIPFAMAATYLGRSTAGWSLHRSLKVTPYCKVIHRQVRAVFLPGCECALFYALRNSNVTIFPLHFKTQPCHLCNERLDTRH